MSKRSVLLKVVVFGLGLATLFGCMEAREFGQADIDRATAEAEAMLAQPQATAREEYSRKSASSPRPIADLPQSSGGGGASTNIQQEKSGDTAGSERKLIKNGNIVVEVKEYRSSKEKLFEFVGNIGGFIANSNEIKNAEGKFSGNIVIRISADRFTETIKFIESLGELKSSNQWIEDVTEQFYDLEARLKNSYRLEERLLEILKTRTSKMSDLLEVERELARVREVIEQMEGRKRHLTARVDRSTITVKLYEPSSIVAKEESSIYPLIKAVKEAATIFFGSLGTLIIFVVAIFPWLVMTLVAVFSIRYFVRRRRERRESEAAVKAVHKTEPAGESEKSQ